MKMRTLIVSVLLISSCIIAKETLKVENQKIDVVGEAYNTDGRPVVAVSYGVANNRAYTLPGDGAGFMKPEMVVKLADVIVPPKPGPKEAVEEVNLKFIINLVAFRD